MTDFPSGTGHRFSWPVGFLKPLSFPTRSAKSPTAKPHRPSWPFLLLLLALPALAAPRLTQSFDSDWRFLKADAPNAQAPAFDDHSWTPVTLPHDWAIAGPFDEHAPNGGAGAFLPTGAGWYRKSFTLPASSATRRVFIEFEGVMANSEVFINGVSLGKRPYGYVSFRYELTAHLTFGAAKPNLLAVRADNSRQPASRWYAGAGIYRHVRLITTDPVHLEQWSTFISTPKVSATEATIRVAATVVNQSRLSRPAGLSVVLIDPSGKAIKTVTLNQSESVAAGKTLDLHVDFPLDDPTLWSLHNPALYRATVSVTEAGKTLDAETVPFGIRDAHFDADKGFCLNGQYFKIKGVCLHGDGGAVGVAVPLRVWERRLQTLKTLGVNGIRTAHNPPAPEFLDLCDRMGFLVMDEMFDQWTVAKNPYDYHLYFQEWSHIDTQDTVRRDRNHPSIVVYSAGNEIHDTPNAPLAKDILSFLVGIFHKNDPTRPVTQALFRPNVSHDYDNGLADLLDVVGQNYRENEILAAHTQKPTRKILGTETTHDRRAWLALRDNAAYAGQFIWAGIDYLGESRAWPAINGTFGLIDRTGAIKPLGFERQSWWSEQPMVHITRRIAAREIPPTDPGYEAYRRSTQTLYDDWTPPNQAAHPENVEVYSNCAEVDLLLNGKSLGPKSLAPDASARNWRVTYEPGTLSAVCNGKTAKAELRTAGAPARISLTSDRTRLTPGFDDVAYLTVTVLDDKGVIVPSASNKVKFTVTGPGAIVAVDNADTNSHEPFTATERTVFQGSAIAILSARAPGPLTVTAATPGLPAATAKVEAAR